MMLKLCFLLIDTFEGLNDLNTLRMFSNVNLLNLHHKLLYIIL